jgi:hypothetical protein
MPMTHDAIKKAVDEARKFFRDTKKNSYCWIVKQAIKNNSQIISPDNMDFLNQYLRDLGVELNNDFFRAYKEVPNAHRSHFAQLIYSQPEVLNENIFGSDELDEDEVGDELAEEEGELLARDFNAQLAINQQQYDEFILTEYRTVLTLAANGKIPFTSKEMNLFFMNASPNIIVQIWRDPEFGAYFEQLSPAFRALITEAIFNKMLTNGPACAELLNSPLPNGDLFLHVVAKLPVRQAGYDIRLVQDNAPAQNEFKSTTTIVVKRIESNAEDKDEQEQKAQPVKYKVTQVIQSDENGNTHVIPLKAIELMTLAKKLELNEAPLNGLNLADKPSIKSVLKFKAYEDLNNLIKNKKGASHFNLMEDVIHKSIFEETNFWALTPAGDSPVVLAAKNNAPLSIAPFIEIKKHVMDQAQQKQHDAKEGYDARKNARPARVNDDAYYYLPYAQKEAYRARLADELKEDNEYANQERIHKANQAQQELRMNGEFGKAALFAASHAKTDAEWKVVTDLMQQGAQTHLFDAQSPLSIVHYAILDNRLNIFHDITGANNPFEVKEEANPVDINYHNPRSARPVSPLICAAESKSVTMETFLALLNLDGIAINEKVAAGETALFNAAKTGQEDKVLALLAKRNIDIESKRNPGDGKTAIQIAEYNGHKNVANLLKLDALITRLYDNNFHRHEDTSFMKEIKQEQVDAMIGNFLNRRDYDDGKFSRTSFILSECLEHYNPRAQNALRAPAARLDLSFARADFVDTSTKLNAMFSLARHSNEDKKYEWLGEIRTKAFARLQQDLAGLPAHDLAAQKELLVGARTAGVFARHRSTCCFFRFGRTDTQVKIDKMIADINAQLGVDKNDHHVARHYAPR